MEGEGGGARARAEAAAAAGRMDRDTAAQTEDARRRRAARRRAPTGPRTAALEVKKYPTSPPER